MTLCLIQEGDKVLLGMKKRGFGEGRWNGFGGKVTEGESIKEAAKRELFEEIGVTAKSLEKRGEINFSWQGKEGVLEVTIFKVADFEGEPTESEEMKPEWFLTSEIPYEKMWSDDTYWLPLFLAGKKFKGKFLFDDKDNILEQELSEL